jgi:hypothetical protein
MDQERKHLGTFWEENIASLGNRYCFWMEAGNCQAAA